MFCKKCGNQCNSEDLFCEKCGTSLTKELDNNLVSENHPPPRDFIADSELLLLGIPLFASLLSYFWVGGLNLLQDPSQKLNLILIFTILSTAIVAAKEVRNNKLESNEGIHSPLFWLISISILWIVMYPVYMGARERIGLKNRSILSILIALTLIGVIVIVDKDVESRKDQVKQSIQELKDTLDGKLSNQSNASESNQTSSSQDCIATALEEAIAVEFDGSAQPCVDSHDMKGNPTRTCPNQYSKGDQFNVSQYWGNSDKVQPTICEHGGSCYPAKKFNLSENCDLSALREN